MPEPHPLLMDDLIVEHQRDLLREAHAGRQLGVARAADRSESGRARTPRPADRPVGERRPWPGLLTIIRRFAMTWAARWTVGALIAVSLVAAGQGRGEASTLDQIVKSFAENVLGQGSVKAVRVSADATVVMRWEAATYKPQNSVAASRELLYAEAALVTGAVLGSVQEIPRIAFTMVRGNQVLAMGEVSRSQGLVLRFAPALGGGTYSEPESRPRLHLPGGDRAASQL